MPHGKRSASQVSCILRCILQSVPRGVFESPGNHAATRLPGRPCMCVRASSALWWNASRSLGTATTTGRPVGSMAIWISIRPIVFRESVLASFPVWPLAGPAHVMEAFIPVQAQIRMPARQCALPAGRTGTSRSGHCPTSLECPDERPALPPVCSDFGPDAGLRRLCTAGRLYVTRFDRNRGRPCPNHPHSRYSSRNKWHTREAAGPARDEPCARPLPNEGRRSGSI